VISALLVMRGPSPVDWCKYRATRRVSPANSRDRLGAQPLRVGGMSHNCQHLLGPEAATWLLNSHSVWQHWWCSMKFSTQHYLHTTYLGQVGGSLLCFCPNITESMHTVTPRSTGLKRRLLPVVPRLRESPAVETFARPGCARPGGANGRFPEVVCLEGWHRTFQD